MTEELRPAHAQVEPEAPPETPASNALPYPRWLLFGLGALCGAAWLGAVALDLGALASTFAHLPVWLPRALHVVLVLAVPTLTLCALRSPRLPARQHARAFYIVEALAMALVALPALLPYTAITLSVPMPIMSLSVALAAVDPRVSERWRASWDHGIEQWWERKDTGSSIALLAGAGFGAVILVTAFVEVTSQPLCGSASRVCFAGKDLVPLIFAAVIFLVASAVTCAAILGYAIGARIARSDRWQ